MTGSTERREPAGADGGPEPGADSPLPAADSPLPAADNPLPAGDNPLPYEFAVVRVVPRVDRGEFVNVGVVVLCTARNFLDCRIEVDRHRLQALHPGLADDEFAAITGALEAFEQTVAGHGPSRALSPSRRFGWLVAPRSTVVQTSRAHVGMTDDPAAALDALVASHVTVDGMWHGAPYNDR